MLNMALVGLLAGSLTVGTPGTGGDEKKTPNADKPTAEAAAPERGPSVFGTPEVLTEADVRSITQDTYAYGRPSAAAPIKVWAEYAYGQTSEEYWDTSGEEVPFLAGEITSQRITGGAQVNFLSFPAFRLGVGAELTAAQNEAQNESVAVPVAPGVNLNGTFNDSDFGLQGLKLYGTARGRVVGIHGGYIFDFGDATTRDLDLVGGTVVSTLGTSDNRNALTFGADFDYPSEVLRLFGGVDYYHVGRINDDAVADADQPEDDDIWNFIVGAGVKFSIVEVGAALQLQTRLDSPTNDLFGTDGIGGHAGTVAPYLRISPPSLPASIFVKGAVQDEYTEYGYALGGANSPKPKIGVTAGISVGFE